MARSPVDHSWKASAICRSWAIFSQPGRWMALGPLDVLCASERAGEITVSIVMACRFRVVAEQEPACFASDRTLKAPVCRAVMAADGPAVRITGERPGQSRDRLSVFTGSSLQCRAPG